MFKKTVVALAILAATTNVSALEKISACKELSTRAELVATSSRNGMQPQYIRGMIAEMKATSLATANTAQVVNERTPWVIDKVLSSGFSPKEAKSYILSTCEKEGWQR
jgi:hypothetical protein